MTRKPRDVLDAFLYEVLQASSMVLFLVSSIATSRRKQFVQPGVTRPLELTGLPDLCISPCITNVQDDDLYGHGRSRCSDGVQGVGRCGIPPALGDSLPQGTQGLFGRAGHPSSNGCSWRPASNTERPSSQTRYGAGEKLRKVLGSEVVQGRRAHGFRHPACLRLPQPDGHPVPEHLFSPTAWAHARSTYTGTATNSWHGRPRPRLVSAYEHTRTARNTTPRTRA